MSEDRFSTVVHPDSNTNSDSKMVTRLPKRYDAFLIYLLPLSIYLVFIAAYGTSFVGNRVNPDFIGYYRIALYWSEFNSSLAVSGYWGPLLSFLMLPTLSVIAEPATVGWSAVFISGFVFLTAGVAFIRMCAFPLKYALFGAFSIGLFTAHWAGQSITGDLLLSGLFLFGVVFLLRSYKRDSVGWAVVAGIMFGLSYLAKTPGLLFGIGAIAGLAMLLLWITREATFRQTSRLSLAALAGLAFVVVPWIVTLSNHYGKFTWTTAAERSQQVTAKNAPPGHRHENFTRFHVPRDGRIASWEDPTEISHTPIKAPIVGLEPSEFKIGLIGHVKNIMVNFWAITGYLITPPWFSLIVAGGLATILHARGASPKLLADTWRVGVLFSCIIFAPYLLSYAKQERYYLAVYPLLLSSSLGLLWWADRARLIGWKLGKRFRLFNPAYLALGFFAAVLWAPLFVVTVKQVKPDAGDEYSVGKRIAATLKDRFGEVGPIAAVGPGNVGLYVALHLGKPFLGREFSLRNKEFLVNNGVKFIVSTIEFESLREVTSIDYGSADITPRGLHVYQIFALSSR